MASNLRRLAVLGPAGTIYPGSAQDYRAASNRTFVKDTKTKWVRLWADWPTLMPNPGQLDATRIASLDAQIVQAKRDGLGVILTSYRFPTWANGTAALTDAPPPAAPPPPPPRAPRPPPTPPHNTTP